MIRLSFPGTKAILTHCAHAGLGFVGFFFFFASLEWMYRLSFWCSFFWQDIKLWWKTCFSRVVPQSYLRGCLPGYHPQFGWNKTFLFLLWIISVNTLFPLMFPLSNFPTTDHPSPLIGYKSQLSLLYSVEISSIPRSLSCLVIVWDEICLHHL